MKSEEFNLQDIINASPSLLLLTRKLENIYNADESLHQITTSIDLSFLTELEELCCQHDIAVHIHCSGTVRVLLRDEADREHTMLVTRRAAQKYAITETSIPCSAYQDEEYSTLSSAFDAFRCVVHDLQDYFQELELIDARCWVVDPQNPTFKDDYRKIVLDDRVWLHVTVSRGGAGGLRVVGGTGSHRYSERLSSRMQLWQPSDSVLDNIVNVLELDSFPLPPPPSDDASYSDDYACAICLSSEGAPQPLCAAPACSSYYHPPCLVQWLVSASGGVVPKLGVVSGACPACLAPIAVSKDDS